MFDEPMLCVEKHGLNAPPYERVAECPMCRSDDFLKFDTVIEKIEMVEKLLPAVMNLNKYMDTLKDTFGTGVKNSDLDDGIEMIAELICETFDFMSVEQQRKIFEMKSENDVDKILMYLKGGL